MGFSGLGCMSDVAEAGAEGRTPQLHHVRRSDCNPPAPPAAPRRVDTVTPMRTTSFALAGALLLSLALHAEKKAVSPPEFAPAPGAAAPMFSPGVLVDGTLYVSGQI